MIGGVVFASCEHKECVNASCWMSGTGTDAFETDYSTAMSQYGNSGSSGEPSTVSPSQAIKVNTARTSNPQCSGKTEGVGTSCSGTTGGAWTDYGFKKECKTST